MPLLYALIAGALLAVRIFGAVELNLLGDPASGVVTALIGFVLAIASALLVDGLIRRLFWRAYFHTTRGHEAPALLRDLATLLVFVCSLSIWLYVDLDFSAAGIFAASGATAVVIGLALQAMILDLFSGLSINMDRSYTIGDWLSVHSPDMGESIYGRVEGITWRCTLIRLEDGRCVLLPNRIVTSNALTNHSRPGGPKRLAVQIGLDARGSSDRVLGILLGEAYKAARLNKLALSPAPSVIMAKVDGDTIFYEVRFYADPNQISPGEARSAMLAAMTGAAQRANLPFPVQQIEVHEPPAVDDAFAARDALQRVPLFAKALDDAQIEYLAANAKPVSFMLGAQIMAEGALESSLYLILEGAARVEISQPSPALPREVAILAGGDIVGEMSLMTGAPRSATVTALTSMRTLVVTKDTIEALLAASPALLDRFSTILAEREDALRRQASQTGSWDFVQRDLIGRMRSFFALAFSNDKRAS